jgi:hypothetical protein
VGQRGGVGVYDITRTVGAQQGTGSLSCRLPGRWPAAGRHALRGRPESAAQRCDCRSVVGFVTPT